MLSFREMAGEGIVTVNQMLDAHVEVPFMHGCQDRGFDVNFVSMAGCL